MHRNGARRGVSFRTMTAQYISILAATSGVIAAWVASVAAAIAITAIVAVLLCSRLFNRRYSDKLDEVKVSLESVGEGKYKPVEIAGGGAETLALVGEINDISERFVKAMRASEDERAKANYVLDNVSQCIIALDGNDVIRIMNAPARKLLERDESFIGRDLYFAVSDAEFLAALTSALKDGKSKLGYKLGDRYLSVSVVKTDSGIMDEISSIIIISDVSAEKLAAKQRSDFFSNAGHELKTPLTSIQGLTELLLDKTQPDSPEYKYAERIHKEAERLGSLVMDMLRLSDIENIQFMRGAGEPVVEVDLKEVATEVVSTLEPEVEKKELTVTVEGAGTVFADQKKIFEIVTNLASNAVNYNKQDGRVDINITETAETVTLKIADTGIGIEKKHIPRLCERFYRVDKSRSKKTGGTGLGLAIVKHVCAIYEAKLDITSEFGEGTTVTVTFFKSKMPHAATGQE